MGAPMSKKPKALPEVTDSTEPYVQCPHCDFIGELDAFDCLGADEGNLFCNECNNEFRPS